MCGPLAAFAALPRGGSHGRAFARPLRWQLGRLASYALLGAFAGAIGARAVRALAPEWASVALSAALAVALLVAAWRMARPERAPRPRLAQIGRAPRTPLAARLLAGVPREPLALGFVTALLPCGALWSAVLIGAGTGSAAAGALALLGFALASGLALLVAGTIGARAMRSAPIWLRRVFAAVLVIGAVIAIVRPLPILTGSPEPSCHHR